MGCPRNSSAGSRNRPRRRRSRHSSLTCCNCVSPSPAPRRVVCCNYVSHSNTYIVRAPFPHQKHICILAAPTEEGFANLSAHDCTTPRFCTGALGTKLILVLGHTKCGAINGATKDSSNLKELVLASLQIKQYGLKRLCMVPTFPEGPVRVPLQFWTQDSKPTYTDTFTVMCVYIHIYVYIYIYISYIYIHTAAYTSTYMYT